MAHLPLQTPFAQFSAQFDNLCESVLGRILNEHRNIRASEDARRLSTALAQLSNVISDIESIHGSQGPHTQWNTLYAQDIPSRTNPRPTTPCRGHSPNIGFPNGNPSPPLTPVAHDRVSELKSKLETMSKTLDDRNAELARMKQATIDSQNENVRNLHALEKARLQLALEHVSSKKYALAAEQYESLSDLKLSEKNRRKLNKDRSGEISAERTYLEYKLQQGKMQSCAGNYSEAEDAIRYVFQTRKTHAETETEKNERRKIQLELCKLLRVQNSKTKSREAESLYYHASSLTHLELQNENDRSWALLNAFYLAFTWTEQGLYDDAIRQLQLIWAKRHKASNDCVEVLEKEFLQIVELLKRHRQTSHVIKTLKLACDDSEHITAQNWNWFADLGRYLSDRGEYQRALTYLRRAWNSPLVSLSQQRRTGWLLAQSLCHTRHFAEAEAIVLHLLDGNDIQEAPSKAQLKALLAYVQLEANQISAAEVNAQLIFDKEGTNNILPHHVFHHANTLIYTLVKQDSKQKYIEARKVWQKIYDQKDHLALTTDGKAQLRHHAEAGRKLATDWEKSARRRSVTPTGALKVKKEAEQIEKDTA